MREPDAPASEKQRAYMDYLLKELGWDGELQSFVAARSLNLLTLTKREASELIDDLKGALAGVDDTTVQAVAQSEPAIAVDDDDLFSEPVAAPQVPIGERATPRQVRALERLVEERGIDLVAELRAHFGDRELSDLSMDEAGQLLSVFQQRPRTRRTA